MTAQKRIELVCPAGTLPALKTAIDHGADCVYLGFRNETNARNFGGLNFDARSAAEGVRYAHARGRKVLSRSIPTPSPARSGAGPAHWISPRTSAWMR